MTCIVLDNQKTLKTLPGHNIPSWRKFKALHRNLRTFQGLSMKFKDFSRLCEPCVDRRGWGNLVLRELIPVSPPRGDASPWQVYPALSSMPHAIPIYITRSSSIIHQRIYLSLDCFKHNFVLFYVFVVFPRFSVDYVLVLLRFGLRRIRTRSTMPIAKARLTVL